MHTFYKSLQKFNIYAESVHLSAEIAEVLNFCIKGVHLSAEIVFLQISAIFAEIVFLQFLQRGAHLSAEIVFLQKGEVLLSV